MPLIQISGFNLSSSEKQNLINELSATASKVTGIEREYFTVVIYDVSGPEAYGHRGKSLVDWGYTGTPDS